METYTEEKHASVCMYMETRVIPTAKVQEYMSEDSFMLHTYVFILCIHSSQVTLSACWQNEKKKHIIPH